VERTLSSPSIPNLYDWVATVEKIMEAEKDFVSVFYSPTRQERK